MIKGYLLKKTNFLKHMKNKHPEQNDKYNAFKQKKRRIREGKKQNYASTSEGMSASSSSTSVPLGNSKGQISFRQTKITQKTFDERIVRFIVETMPPISLVSHESFVRIFEGMDVKVMNRFAAVTCHWIDQDLSRRSVAIVCRRFEVTHYFDKIGELLNEIHRGYNLDNKKKILATVTDNGSNFVKCFKEFGILLDSHYNVGNADDQTQERKGETEGTLPEFESIIESTDLERSFSQTR
ncbi:unnamed protein product [Psylliodes chrysocephalus]|uniref:Transposase n=1 Tax=Psylliodes chrysocephalus TaxID=3402493 RepID=A0A9P0CX74_9CUCU|nr:unnamed protein product [Psylliodes chrysocephala]